MYFKRFADFLSVPSCSNQKTTSSENSDADMKFEIFFLDILSWKFTRKDHFLNNLRIYFMQLAKLIYQYQKIA